MGNTSKIPTSYPGQVLKLIGIDEIDIFYMTQEANIQRIDHVRTEVDLRFTDFLRNLGARKLWERCPNFQEVMRMLIVVLSTNGKGNIHSIAWQDESPYINFESNVFSYKLRLLIEDYTDYVNTVESFKNEMLELKNNFDLQIIQPTLKSIYKEVTEKLINAGYSTNDMITCVEIIDKNDSLIRKSISNMDKLIHLAAILKNDIKIVFDESKIPPRLDKIIQQAAQAMFEGLSTPETIVTYFWPYPSSN